MNNGQKSLSINETFIIEAENDGTMSACTGFFTNALVSCTGNTQIILSTNIIEANSAFSATTFYGDGSNLTGISTQDTFVTGGTYFDGVTTFTNNTGGTFNVSGYFKPSDDIYVTSGVVDHGPSNSANNLLTLTRSDSSSVIISDLVNISDTTKPDIDSLIGAKRIIRGKTYKISGCDDSLYYNGTDRRDDPVYTSIYLMGLENDKLSETGIGIFYTPKYSDFDIFRNEVTYSEGSRVIWGGYVWNCFKSGSYNSVDIFTLDPSGFEIVYPFQGSKLNSDLYNIQYDDIIYDYENDRIIYRNEQDTNIVQTSFDNISYWVNDFGYNPIKVFQWGNVYDINKDRGIGNQRIINSYNENINFNGRYQINFYFDNLSFQRHLRTNGSVVYQSNFVLTNQSSIDKVTLRENAYQKNIYLSNESKFDSVEIYQDAYQSYVTLDNFSYFLEITLQQGCIQNHLSFNNNSYQQTILLINDGDIARQEFFNFTNESSQVGVSIQGVVQSYFNFNSGNQNNSYLERPQTDINIENGSQTNVSATQSNITIKGYDLDWSSYPSVTPQTNLFFINDLPTETTSRLIGKKENRLVEVSDFYYDGSKWIVEGGFSATTISATTYNGYTPLPTQAASSTGVILSFVTDTVYGTLATPETGTTISADTTNGQLGVTNIVIHSGGTAPTFSSQYKKLSGSGNYTTGQINYIFATYITSTEIIYAINQRT